MGKKVLGVLHDWQDMCHFHGKVREDDIRVYAEKCLDAGIQRLYWRVTHTGPVSWYSKIEDVYHGDIRTRRTKTVGAALERFDMLRLGVKYAHEVGLEIHPWFTVYDAAFHDLNLCSRLYREHPEYVWETRDGEKKDEAFSLAFPEVRAYKLSLVKEIITYGVDGVLLDFRRPYALDRTDSLGVSIYGYEKPAVEAYRNRYGVDPRKIDNTSVAVDETGYSSWIRFRAEYNTQFLRELRKYVDGLDNRLEVATLIYETNNLAGHLIDWETWANEGLVDVLCPYDEGYADVARGYKQHIKDKCKLFVVQDILVHGAWLGWPVINGPDLAWKPEFFLQRAKSALNSGADGIILGQTMYIETCGYWDTVKNVAELCNT